MYQLWDVGKGAMGWLSGQDRSRDHHQTETPDVCSDILPHAYCGAGTRAGSIRRDLGIQGFLQKSQSAKMPNATKSNPPMTETIDSANAAASTLFLGHNGEWWDFWLIMSLVAVALAAIAAGVTTTGSIVSHKREAESAEVALERFKLQTEQKISEADARAAEAQLALEKFKAPRSISVEARNRLVESMKEFAGQQYFGMVASDVADAWDIWREISLALESAGWKRLPPPGAQARQYGPPAGIAVAAQAGVMILGSAGRSSPEETMATHERAKALAAKLTDESIIAGPGFAIELPANTIAIVIGPKP
jgi:hypothetical protein